MSNAHHWQGVTRTILSDSLLSLDVALATQGGWLAVLTISRAVFSIRSPPTICITRTSQYVPVFPSHPPFFIEPSHGDTSQSDRRITHNVNRSWPYAILRRPTVSKASKSPPFGHTGTFLPPLSNTKDGTAASADCRGGWYIDALSIPASYALTNSLTVSSAGHCYDTNITVNISTLNYELDISAPKDQASVTDFVVRWTSESSNVTKEVVGEPVRNDARYRIYAVFCVPEKQDEKKTVELAIHGINFDHTYWSFGGKGSKYNYAESALNAGHAILIYDRLGIGRSEKPDGIKEVQTPTEVEIAAQLIQYLKSTPRGLDFERYIGIGHSYGSAQLTGLASKYGNLLNATILTGFTSYLPSVLPAFATWTLTVAAEQNPQKFKGLPTTYVVSNNRINDQQNFFAYGGYDPAVIGPADAAKQPCTFGELLTILEPIPAGGPTPAPAYTNPVLVVTGDKDYIFCGGDCYQEVNGVNIVAGTKEAFPSVPESDFATYIPARTGHGVNLHLSAPETYEEIQRWIASLS